MPSILRTLSCMVLCTAALSWPRAGVASSPAANAGSFTTAAAPQNGHAKHDANGKGKGSDKDAHGTVVVDHHVWTDRDHCHVVFLDYYDRHGLPPGLAKKNSLPPGLRKQVRERGHVPPGLDKHWVVLPTAFERELPPLPPHHVRRAVGEDLLVIDVRANLIVSFMAGVFVSR
jgi:hypothetical protein